MTNWTAWNTWGANWTVVPITSSTTTGYLLPPPMDLAVPHAPQKAGALDWLDSEVEAVCKLARLVTA